MNASTKAACALVVCETEFIVRRMGRAFESRVGRTLRRLARLDRAPCRLFRQVATPGVALAHPAFNRGCRRDLVDRAGNGACSMLWHGYARLFVRRIVLRFAFLRRWLALLRWAFLLRVAVLWSPHVLWAMWVPFCAPPCGRPMGCCGPACSGGCGCGCPRFSLGIFPGRNCCPGYAPVCGPPCGSPFGSPCGSPYGLACGPGCGSPACSPACGCPGGGSPCGGGYPMPTYETPAVPQPSSGNRAGTSTIEPTDPSPEGPPTPIKKRSATPPDGAKFERQPQGSLDAAAGLDMSQASAEPAERCEKRFFRQSVSAGFRTRVLISGSGRFLSQVASTKSPSSSDFLRPRALARTD